MSTPKLVPSVVSYRPAVLNAFFALLFVSGGIGVRDEGAAYEAPYTACVTAVAILQLLGCAVGFANTSSMANRTEILLQVTSHLYFVALHWCLKLNRRALRAFVGRFRHLGSRLPDRVAGDVDALTRRFFVDSLKVALTAFSAFLLVIGSVSLVTPLFVRFDFDDKYVYVMPFWFRCSSTRENRFPVPFLCWNIDAFHKYALMNGIEIALFAIELFPYLTSFAFFTFTQAHFKAHLLVILGRIECLKETACRRQLPDVGVPWAPCDRRRRRLTTGNYDGACDEFVDIIEHHQYLRQVVNSILTFLQWVVTFSLAGFTAAVIFSIFLFITENGGEGELLFKVKMISIVANGVVMFFLYCHGAEVTSHLNEDISNAVYNTSWYSESAQFRKISILFMIQLQKSMGISAFRMYKMNLYFFMRVMRTVYSALNVLLMSVKQ